MKTPVTTERGVAHLSHCVYRFSPYLHILTVNAICAIILLGLLLRLHGLAAQSLWIDEGVSVWVASKSMPSMLLWLAKGDVHPPLYFILLHFWMMIDDTVYWIRFLSVIPSVLTILFLYGLGTRLHSQSVGFLSALLLAISPFSIYFAQEARMYSLLGLMATAASYCLVWGLQSRKTAAWVCYAIMAAGGLYTQQVGGLTVVLTHGVILLTYYLHGKREGATGLYALAAGIVAWLPWFAIMLYQISRGAVAWIANPSPHELTQLFLSFTSHLLPDPIRLSFLTIPLSSISLAVVLVYLGLACLGIFSLRHRRGQMLIASFLLGGPLVVELNAGLLQPVFIDRTLIPVAAVYALLLAAGLIQLFRHTVGRPIAVTACGALLLLNLSSLNNIYNHYEKENWNSTASYVAWEGRQGDIIVFNGNSSQLPFNYYYSRFSATELPQLSVPCELDRCYRFEAPADAEDQSRIGSEVSDYQRMWLVKRWWGNWDFTAEDAVGSKYAKQLRFIEEKDLGGVVVTLYEVGDEPTAQTQDEVP